MTPESLPSGVLKVADVKRLADDMARKLAQVARARHVPNSMLDLTECCEQHREAQVAFHSALAALASPPPQATGALSEPLTEQQLEKAQQAWCDADPSSFESSLFGFARAIEAAHGITAASQVEPEDK